MVQKNILDKFPVWYKDLKPEKHYLVMTDDFDSYYSCRFLKKKFNLEIGGFYQFETGLWLNAERTKGKQPIYVDLSITEGMTFDNHYTFIKNPLAINPNINTTVYNRKFNGSTLALLYGLYDKDLSRMSKNALTALLCIDGWYIGYYNKGGKYRNINLYWYDVFGMSDYLLPVLEQHNKQYFIDFISDYQLNEPINIDDGYLFCAVDVPLPECKFELVQPVKKKFVDKYKAISIYKKQPKSIIVSAETYYNNYVINQKENKIA